MTFIESNDDLPTLEQWRERGHDGAAISVGNDVDVESFAAELPRLAVIALQFPKWVDGRAYSQAKLLRTRYRFGGQIRATGDVVVDMLPLLARTGFDAVRLRDGQDVDAARRALGFFDGHYQGDAAEPRPLFARSGS